MRHRFIRNIAAPSTILLLVIFALSGACAPDHAVFERKDVWIRGKPSLFARTKWRNVTVGGLGSPHEIPEFRIRLDSGRVVSTRELTPDLIDFERTEVRPQWPRDARAYECKSYWLVFVGNRLVELRTWGGHPAFGKAGTGPMYELPLTTEQATEVFGKADKEYRYSMWNQLLLNPPH